MTNESSSDELSPKKTTSKLRRNKHEGDEEGVEALLQLRRQRSRNIDEPRLPRIPQHSITRASVRISVGYNILQLK
jgi:hypothetical protein